MQLESATLQTSREFLIEQLRHAQSRAAHFSRAMPRDSRGAFREAQAQLDRIANAWADALDRFERAHGESGRARIIPFPGGR